MRNTISTQPLLALALLGVFTIIGVGPAQAQENTGGSPQNITLAVDQAPVQSVLKRLFIQAGKNYSIDPSVQGTVSVNLQNVSFDVALRSVLRASNPVLMLDVLGSIYAIKVKPADVPVQPAPATQTSGAPSDAIHTYRLPIESYDAYYLAMLMQQGQGIQVVQSNYVNPGAAGSTGGNTRRGNNGGTGGRNGRRGSRNG